MTTNVPSCEQRAAVFDEILRELEDVCPELSDVHHDRDPGALVELYEHLDELVAIVRRSMVDAAAGRFEPYLVQINERICSTCPQDQTDGYCPLRLRNTCVLSAHATRIARAIGRALSKSRDGSSRVLGGRARVAQGG
jgi:hypothetical protein